MAEFSFCFPADSRLETSQLLEAALGLYLETPSWQSTARAGEPLSKANLVRAGSPRMSSLLMNSESVRGLLILVVNSFGIYSLIHTQVEGIIQGVYTRGQEWGGDILEGVYTRGTFCPPLSVTQFSQL